MERSSKRGKIPQQDWPSIIKRYEAGETLTSIARTYNCSPPAISYILNRSRARDSSAEPPKSGALDLQPTEVNQHANDSRTESAAPAAPQIKEGSGTPPAESHPSPNGSGVASGGETEFVAQIGSPPDRRLDEPGRAAVPSTNGNSPPMSGTAASQPQTEEPRRTLHLSSQHNGTQQMEIPQGAESGTAPDPMPIVPSGGLQQSPAPRPVRENPVPYASVSDGGAVRTNGGTHTERDGGVFIDRALRERVDGDISAFLAAFDAALADDTIESRAGLRQATDRLLRAGARTRIELERLEARVPLPARDAAGNRTANWRLR